MEQDKERGGGFTWAMWCNISPPADGEFVSLIRRCCAVHSVHLQVWQLVRKRIGSAASARSRQRISWASGPGTRICDQSRAGKLLLSVWRLPSLPVGVRLQIPTILDGTSQRSVTLLLRLKGTGQINLSRHVQNGKKKKLLHFDSLINKFCLLKFVFGICLVSFLFIHFQILFEFSE